MTTATPDDGHKYVPSGSRRLGRYHECERCGRPPYEHDSRGHEEPAGEEDG